jgi:NADH-quinone oxidoreductase subunit C
MTLALSAGEIAAKLGKRFADGILEVGQDSLVLKAELLLDIASFLKATPGLDFDYLASITGVDYRSYFEVVYHLVSLEHNHSLVIKVRCHERDGPVVPSVVSLWQGADFQEREIFDLMGIRFNGHPNMKRIFLWEGFRGHTLRKDYNNGA